MRVLGVFILVVAVFCSAHAHDACCSGRVIDARFFFEHENELLQSRRHAEEVAVYEYNTNLTEENRLEMMAITTRSAAANKRLAQTIKERGYDRINAASIRRQAKMLSNLGNAVLEPEDYEALQNAVSAMQKNYATATVCAYMDPNNCTLSLEPTVQERLTHSRDHRELEHYWREWYDKAGTPMRSNFSEYVRLSTKAAHLNGFSSYAEYWLHFYEYVSFERNIDDAYNAILPLYREIHAYVRYRLSQHYGDAIVPPEGNIPMHLLGNMWGQQWNEAIDVYTPYPEKPFIDVTAEMTRQGYTVQKLFELGDQFFQSLGMRALPGSFWNLSVLVRPTDRPIVCHASAWDMYQDSDVRIKMCTEVNTHYLYVVHHELGHIQYYLQYEQQKTSFRGAPNPAFHEAVGDVIAMSVSSHKHLNRIGLAPSGVMDERSRINELFKTALKKIVFLPFAYAIDKYRHAVFRGDLHPSQWSCAFWQMRSELTGVEPPVGRTDFDFDPPAKYHVASDVEYLRYFAAHIFQFQFHKALCCKAGEYVYNDPDKTLDNCDIYESSVAGAAFSKLLSQGASKHWKEVLEEFTGETEMDPAALLEYFEPLRVWLERENRRLNINLGWAMTDKVISESCPHFST